MLKRGNGETVLENNRRRGLKRLVAGRRPQGHREKQSVIFGAGSNRRRAESSAGRGSRNDQTGGIDLRQ